MYLGEGGWSTWEKGVGVLGRGGLEYLGEGLGEGGWSTWEGLEYLRGVEHREWCSTMRRVESSKERET